MFKAMIKIKSILKMKGILLAGLFLSFTATAAMTEKECENQAKGVYTLLEMISDGSVPANDLLLERLAAAEEHYKKGEYCAARSIILSLNK